MKIIFLLALLSNIIFFLWEFNSRPVSASVRIAENTEERQILLLSELLEKQKCYQIGPFVKNNNLKNWIRLNNIDSTRVTLHQIETIWYAQVLIEEGESIGTIIMPEKKFLSGCKQSVPSLNQEASSNKS